MRRLPLRQVRQGEVLDRSRRRRLPAHDARQCADDDPIHRFPSKIVAFHAHRRKMRSPYFSPQLLHLHNLRDSRRVLVSGLFHLCCSLVAVLFHMPCNNVTSFFFFSYSHTFRISFSFSGKVAPQCVAHPDLTRQGQRRSTFQTCNTVSYTDAHVKRIFCQLRPSIRQCDLRFHHSRFTIRGTHTLRCQEITNRRVRRFVLFYRYRLF